MRRYLAVCLLVAILAALSAQPAAAFEVRSFSFDAFWSTLRGFVPAFLADDTVEPGDRVDDPPPPPKRPPRPRRDKKLHHVTMSEVHRMYRDGTPPPPPPPPPR